MNPSNSAERSPMNLPAPVPEVAPSGASDGAVQGTPEANVGAPENAAGTARPGLQTLPAVPFQIPQTMQPGDVSSVVPSTTPSSTVSATDNADLIDKESVQKAKQIIETHREDPYVQSKELNNFRVDYMKKNYNKSIKLSE